MANRICKSLLGACNAIRNVVMQSEDLCLNLVKKLIVLASVSMYVKTYVTRFPISHHVCACDCGGDPVFNKLCQLRRITTSQGGTALPLKKEGPEIP